jgi:hypothetical protein
VGEGGWDARGGPFVSSWKRRIPGAAKFFVPILDRMILVYLNNQIIELQIMELLMNNAEQVGLKAAL